jgi:hypothetical protein
MCQRRQKSARFAALYGESKFLGKRTPRSSAEPMAMSV